MSSSSRDSSSEPVAYSDTSRPIDAPSLNRTARKLPDYFPTLDQLLAMPAKDRGPYLEAAANAAAQAYENDPSLTEFTSLDGEDFEDDSE